MNFYERLNGKQTEIAVDDHVSDYDFLQICKQNGHRIEPGTIKQIWEAARYKGRKVIFERCSGKTHGAYKLTIGMSHE